MSPPRPDVPTMDELRSRPDRLSLPWPALSPELAAMVRDELDMRSATPPPEEAPKRPGRLRRLLSMRVPNTPLVWLVAAGISLAGFNATMNIVIVWLVLV